MCPAVRTSVSSLLAALVVLATAAGASAAAPSRVLVLGDSLAVGLEPYLGTMLQPSEVLWDARSGRTTPQALPLLRARLREETPRTVVLSLGTNDGSDPRRFADRIRRALAAIPAGVCVVWVDVNRPPRKGSYVALNQVLRDAARKDPRMVVVDWDRAVLTGRVTLPDGLHPDPAGFRLRSRLVANAVAHGCRARPS
ncbi:MAG TPA: GDSL-type esterase/lipase family protein [Baekduia sp.]|uniref:GDSL-type esterase/lipase family protein n=1 Tax=Baekduia sp. TaxID=2600305 RepID=UPI002BEE3495|nr:GDSL-type esterase/lipase family protein [Baekduia sp.]HMJ33499.1 GDSL-type esterase/lipase family protein [Baekduia sp.]